MIERATHWRIGLPLTLSLLLLPRSLFAAGEWDRNGVDRDDLAIMTARDPKLGALLLRGEAELNAGSISTAARTFKQLTESAPESAFAQRRYCQALTELGDRKAAIAACEAALGLRKSYLGFGALVGALLSKPPTPEELVLAAQLANVTRQHVDDQPWGLAAQGLVAERTGDEQMLQKIVVELERIAPDHYETVRARRALDSFRLPTWAFAVWGALALALIGSAVHAAAAAWRRPRSRRRLQGSATAALLLCGLLLSRSTWAAEPAPNDVPPAEGLSKWPINDADPKQSLPTSEQRDKNPMEFGYHMMDLADKADIAKRKGDFAAVAKYYEAMAVAVPDRAIGYRRSCEAYEQVGNTEKALQMCRGALGADGLEVDDYLHFSKLLLAKPGALEPTDVEDLSQIATHLKAEQGAMAAGLKVQCDLAQRLDDAKRLEECATAVAKETPDDPKLVIYQWGVAMKQEDYARARQLIATARKSSLLPAGIEAMQRMTDEQSAPGRRVARLLVRHAAPLIASFALLLAVGFGFWFRKRLKLRLA
ncbi:MAG: hypothetical protein ABW061_05685 [Polyangiaceae bacterium]